MKTNDAWVVDYTPATPLATVQGVISAIVVATSMGAAQQRILTEHPGVRIISCDHLGSFVYY